MCRLVELDHQLWSRGRWARPEAWPRASVARLLTWNLGRRLNWCARTGVPLRTALCFHVRRCFPLHPTSLVVATPCGRLANRHFCSICCRRLFRSQHFPLDPRRVFLTALVGFQAGDWQILPSFRSAAARMRRQSKLERLPKAKRRKEVNIICRVLFSCVSEKELVLFNQ